MILSNRERNPPVALATVWSAEEAQDLYGINRWGRDYFSVNRKGHLVIRPSSTSQNFVDIHDVVTHLSSQGLNTPILLRFPQLIQDRIKMMYDSFGKARKEYGFKGHLRAVFPLKVNQEKEVIESILQYGRPFDYGLEVGSKPELLAGLARKDNPRALLVCNGFKDQDFVDLAFYGSLYHKNVILVIERIDEIDMVIKAFEKTGAKPMIGLRMKLSSRGAGKWVESGGEKAKFGLKVPALMVAVERLKKAKLLRHVRMVHFHIGSQISDIKRITNGMREATRLYAELIKLKVPLKYMDVGGGMAIDYDGSQSTASQSCNYDMNEYAQAITYTIMSICDDEGVPHPDIIAEAGRGIASYHSMVVGRVMERTPVPELEEAVLKPAESDPLPIHELYESLEEIGPRNYIGEYHDALMQRDDLLSLFNLGQINLAQRAKGETLFRQVCERALKYVSKEDDLEEFEEELSDLKRLVGHKWVVNFSLFQSTPDIWGVKQVFPIVPIQRLNEEPNTTGTIIDLTCDSDGEIKKFIDVRHLKDVLDLHEPNGDPYYLAFLLLGAYQDVLGNSHNLYGPPDEAFITVTRGGKWKVERIVHGWTADHMLASMNWDARELLSGVEHMVEREANVSPETASAFLRAYRRTLSGTVYLSDRMSTNGAAPG